MNCYFYGYYRYANSVESLTNWEIILQPFGLYSVCEFESLDIYKVHKNKIHSCIVMSISVSVIPRGDVGWSV